jgi:hypothetical protein
LDFDVDLVVGKEERCAGDMKSVVGVHKAFFFAYVVGVCGKGPLVAWLDILDGGTGAKME